MATLQPPETTKAQKQKEKGKEELIHLLYHKSFDTSSKIKLGKQNSYRALFFMVSLPPFHTTKYIFSLLVYPERFDSFLQ